MTFYRRCAELLEAGRSVVTITVVEASSGSPAKQGFKMLLSDAGEAFGTVGGGKLEHHAMAVARELFGSGGVRLLRLDLAALGMVCGGEVTLLLETVASGRPFLVFGGGHVGRALAPILASLGYRVTVRDARPEAREWLEGMSSVSVDIGPYADLSSLGELIRRTRHCFIATHAHEHDWDVLQQLLDLSPEWEYVGLIGSRRKARETHERLRAAGRAVPAFLYTPAGIPIGGDGPAEIALAVAAEVVAVAQGREVPHLRAAEPPGDAGV